MSNAALNWAIEQAITGSKKAVLIILANHVRCKTNSCWPSMERLARHTGLTSRTVRAGVRDLEQIGLVKTEHFNGSRSRYTLSFDPSENFVREADISAHPVTLVEQVGRQIPSDTPEYSATWAGNFSITAVNFAITQEAFSAKPIEPIKNPKENPVEEPTLSSTSPSAPERAPSSDLFPEVEKQPETVKPREAATPHPQRAPAPLAEAIAIWNGICVPKLPAVALPTEQRRRAFASRFHAEFHGDLTNFEALCHTVVASDFLCGSGTFRASFDWVLKPANLAKILEGNYANRRGTGPKAMPTGVENAKFLDDYVNGRLPKVAPVYNGGPTIDLDMEEFSHVG